MKGIFLIVFSLASSITFANCASDYCQDVLVEEIELKKNGDLVFTTSGTESNMYCDAIGGTGILLQKSGNIAYSEMYALLVSSQESQLVLMGMNTTVS